MLGLTSDLALREIGQRSLVFLTLLPSAIRNGSKDMDVMELKKDTYVMELKKPD